MENIMMVKEIMERSKQPGKELYLVFIDVERACDSVNRTKFIQLLEHIGVDPKIVKVQYPQKVCRKGKKKILFPCT